MLLAIHFTISSHIMHLATVLYIFYNIIQIEYLLGVKFGISYKLENDKGVWSISHVVAT